jgi:hypothetical protein
MRHSKQVSESLRRIVSNQLVLANLDLHDLSKELRFPYSTTARLLANESRWSDRHAGAAARWLAAVYDADPRGVLENLLDAGGPSLPFLRELQQCATFIPDKRSLGMFVKRLAQMRCGKRVLRFATFLLPLELFTCELRECLLGRELSPLASLSASDRERLFQFGELGQEEMMVSAESAAREIRFLWPTDLLTMLFGRAVPFDQCEDHLIEELVEFWRYDCLNNRGIRMSTFSEDGVGLSILRHFANFAELELIDNDLLIRRVAGRAVWQLFDARDGNPATRSIVESAAQILRLCDEIAQPVDLTALSLRERA